MTQAMEPRMDQQPSPKPSAAKKGRGGLIAAVLIGLGLAALVGSRVKETIAERAAVQATVTAGAKGAETSAPSEKSATGEASAYTTKRVHGKAVRGEPVVWKPSIQ